MQPNIRNISKSYSVKSKALRYEVCVYYRQGDENEVPEIVAKFQAQGDAALYAQDLQKRPGACSYSEILVR